VRCPVQDLSVGIRHVASVHRIYPLCTALGPAGPGICSASQKSDRLLPTACLRVSSMRNTSKQGVIVPKPGTQRAFSGLHTYPRAMRYRKALCITIDPLTLAVFDEMIFDEAHSKRMCSGVIEDTMCSLIAAWKKEKQSRAIAMGAVNRFFCAECAGDLINPSKKRDVPVFPPYINRFNPNLVRFKPISRRGP